MGSESLDEEDAPGRKRVRLEELGEEEPAPSPFQALKVKGQSRDQAKKPARDLYSLMASKRKKKQAKGAPTEQLVTSTRTEASLDTSSTVSSFPLERSIKNMFRILSTAPIEWFNASFTDREVSPECLRLREAASLYGFPSRVAVPVEFQQLHTRAKESRQPSQVLDFFAGIKRDW